MSEKEVTVVEAPSSPVPHERSGAGMVLGVLVFLGGVALLLLTFKLAYDMFTTPPADTLGVKAEGIDFTKAWPNLVGVLVRILLLIVMGVMGSLIANRGVTLFIGSRTHRAR